MTASAHTGSGINEVWKLILSYKEQTTGSGFFDHHRNSQNIAWLQHQFQHLLQLDFKNSRVLQKEKTKLEGQIRDQTISPKKAAEKLLNAYHREVRKRKP